MLNFLGVESNFSVLAGMAWTSSFLFRSDTSGAAYNLDGVTFKGSVFEQSEKALTFTRAAADAQKNVIEVGIPALREGRWRYAITATDDSGASTRLLSGFVTALGSLPTMNNDSYAKRTLLLRMPDHAGEKLQVEWAATTVAEFYSGQSKANADKAEAQAKASASSATAAAASASAAKTSENNAKNSATAAKNSENAAAASATKAKESETHAANSATSAGLSSSAALESANKAKASETEAAASAKTATDERKLTEAAEDKARGHADDARASANAAKSSASAAAADAEIAKEAAGKAVIAEEDIKKAEEAASAAFGYSDSAKASANAAKTSETNAKNSATQAASSATSASGSATQAASSATAAAKSAADAASSAEEVRGLVLPDGNNFDDPIIGAGATGEAGQSVALGRGAIASATQSVSIGYSSKASGSSSVAIGQEGKAVGFGSVCIGSYSNAGTLKAIAIGQDTTAKDYAVAIGPDTNANINSIGIGNQVRATGYESMAIGWHTTSTGQRSLAIGSLASATATNAIVIGSSKNIYKDSALVLLGSGDTATWFYIYGEKSELAENTENKPGLCYTKADSESGEVGADAKYISLEQLFSGGGGGSGDLTGADLDNAATTWDIEVLQEKYKAGESTKQYEGDAPCSLYWFQIGEQYLSDVQLISGVTLYCRATLRDIETKDPFYLGIWQEQGGKWVRVATSLNTQTQTNGGVLKFNFLPTPISGNMRFCPLSERFDKWPSPPTLQLGLLVSNSTSINDPDTYCRTELSGSTNPHFIPKINITYAQEATPAGGGDIPEGNNFADPIIIGDGASSSAGQGIAIGKNATSGQYAVSIGLNANNTNSPEAVVIGKDAGGQEGLYEGWGFISIGSNSHCNGGETIAIGDSAGSYAEYAISMGYAAYAKGTYDIAIGNRARTEETGTSNISIGSSATCSDSWGIAIGLAAQSNASTAMAFGYSAKCGYQATTLIRLGTPASHTDLYFFDGKSKLSQNTDGEAGIGYVSGNKSGCIKLSALLTDEFNLP